MYSVACGKWASQVSVRARISASATCSTRCIRICYATSHRVLRIMSLGSISHIVRLKHGWMYLVAVIDWYSRYIVSWQLDQTLEMSFVLTAVKAALRQAKPEIWNSDQGSHFTSEQYMDLLKEAGVRISMDGKNRALDNIITERCWRTLKYEGGKAKNRSVHTALQLPTPPPITGLLSHTGRGLLPGGRCNTPSYCYLKSQ